jgi:superfamily II DNA or RNA helicase
LQAEQRRQEEHEARQEAKKEQALKSGNAKLYNFMQGLWEKGLPREQFATEVDRYFQLHSLRKANVQRQLEEQLNAEIEKSERITSQIEQMEQHQTRQSSELYQLFVEHISKMKEDMRQRRILTQLKNIKSIKIRTEQIEIPDINSITIS